MINLYSLYSNDIIKKLVALLNMPETSIKILNMYGVSFKGAL